MGKTSIAWAASSDNPFVLANGGHYCEKISPLCKGCYASKLNRNTFFKGTGTAYPWQSPGAIADRPEFTIKRELLASWGRARSQNRTLFHGSMTDLLGDWIDEQWVFDALDAMLAAPQNYHLFTTKRCERAYVLITKWLEMRDLESVPDHIWPGFSLGIQVEIDRYLPLLSMLRADCKWVSFEPHLEALVVDKEMRTDHLKGLVADLPANGRINPIRGPHAFHWGVIGGESQGDNSLEETREWHLEWGKALSDQLRAVGIHVFFKQTGRYPIYQGRHYQEALDFDPVKGANPEGWPNWMRIQEFPHPVNNPTGQK